MNLCIYISYVLVFVVDFIEFAYIDLDSRIYVKYIYMSMFICL